VYSSGRASLDQTYLRVKCTWPWHRLQSRSAPLGISYTLVYAFRRRASRHFAIANSSAVGAQETWFTVAIRTATVKPMSHYALKTEDRDLEINIQPIIEWNGLRLKLSICVCVCVCEIGQIYCGFNLLNSLS